MKKALIIIVSLIGLVFLYLYVRDSRERRLVKRGNEIVKMIESYRYREGRLPNSLEEIGVHGEDELFYNKWDSVHYMIWFGTSLGESNTYYSDTKNWEETQRGFK